MITLPDFDRPFDHENAYWLTAAPGRFGKALAHYELYKIAARLQGAIVERGVFKGASLAHFAMLQALFDETKAVDDYFGGSLEIRRFPLVETPCYVVT